MRRHGGGLEPTTSFAALLKRYRLAAGLSQEALAERAHLSARAISAYERGIRHAPYLDSVRQLVRALNLSEEEQLVLEAAVQRHRGPKTSPSADTRTAKLNNLPSATTSFVGRQHEVAEAKRALEQTRLLTLVGSGGCGKTRLALQVARDLVEAYPDGVWLVDFASLTDPLLVAQALAASMGVRNEPARPLLDTVCAALQSRQLLLVLDNCEHLLESCAQLAEVLMRECPSLRILATSRQALGIEMEISWRVPSLSIPDAGEAAGSVSSYEAVQLFIERAQDARSGFAFSWQNASAAAQVCRRLDGIPLAIELAAARVRVLSVEQIAQRLDNHLQLLTGGGHQAVPRHRTLRATLDWSYALLTDAEQALFRRLAVFAGSFNLDAVEAIAGSDAPSVLDLLTGLVDKSMLQVEVDETEARYRLLETLRQYSHERLVESGDMDSARRLHREWYRSLAERAEPELIGPHQRLWLDRVEQEHDNIRAIIDGNVVDRDELMESLEVVAKLLRLWIVRGYLGECRRLLERLFVAADAYPEIRRAPAWLGALHTAGFAAYFQGDFEAMRRYGELWLEAARDVGTERDIWMANDMLARVFMNQGDYSRAHAIFVEQLAVVRRLDYSFGIASALVGLSVVARLQGDHDAAIAHCDECLRETRRSGDVWFIGQALSNLGLAYFQLGQYGVARKQFEEALALRRELGDRSGMAWSLINLGDVAHAQGDLVAARVRFEESLSILRELGDRSGRAEAIAALGRVAWAQGDFASARLCFVESLTLQRDLDQRVAMPRVVEDLAVLAAAHGEHERALMLESVARTIRAALGERTTEARAPRVTAMTLDQAIAYALSDADSGIPAPRLADGALLRPV